MTIMPEPMMAPEDEGASFERGSGRGLEFQEVETGEILSSEEGRN